MIPLGSKTFPIADIWNRPNYEEVEVVFELPGGEIERIGTFTGAEAKNIAGFTLWLMRLGLRYV